MPRRLANLPAISPQFACFRLRRGRSAIQGLGIYAGEPIPPRRKVIEYTGEKMNWQETLRRLNGKHYHYIFRLSRRWFLDGRIGGSGAQYVNHCCDPNLFSWRVNGHILLMSRRRILPGEELTMDYHYSPDAIQEPCHCGSPMCRGTINLRTRRNRSKTKQ